MTPTPSLATVFTAMAILAGGMATRASAEATHFENATERLGLSGVTAKDCIFTDFDGDGRWDLVLNRRRFFHNVEGRTFVEVEPTGIEFPVVEQIPLDGKSGEPNLEKRKEAELVPHYMYFADLDNDGDQDAICGVHSSWEWGDERGRWRSVPECDHGQRTTVYLNEGFLKDDGGSFKRARASEISAANAAHPAMALAILDFDGDGRLDLYEGSEYRLYGHLDNCGVDRLWKGDGKGGFKDVTEATGLMTVPEPAGPRSSRPSYGVTHADVDGDGRQDLLQLSYGRQWNYLWRNLGDGKFEEVGMSSGYAGDDITHGRYPEIVNRPAEKPFRANGNTFDCAVGDFDNDGDLDLFLGEIQHWWAGDSSDPSALLVNLGVVDGKLRFERRSWRDFLPDRPFRNPERWNTGDLHVAWLDFDNDTRLDLLIGSGDYPDGQFLRLYRQKEDGAFEDATDAAGFDWEGCGDLSIGDFDQDGGVDIVAGRSFMRLSAEHREKFMGGIEKNEVGVFRNLAAAASGNHWLGVRLVGKGAGGANRSGLGARVLVTTGELTQIRELRGGSGLANHQDAPEASFGLGKAKKIDRLVVRWNDAAGSETVLEDVEVDQFLVVRQK